MIVDNAVYENGRRRTGELALEDTYEACRRENTFAWIALYEPTADEVESVRREFELHELAVEDAIKAHQRPKLERYRETAFVLLKPDRHVDETETIEFGEIHVFVGPSFVVTVRHGQAPDLGASVAGWKANPICCVAGRWRSSTRPTSGTSRIMR